MKKILFTLFVMSLFMNPSVASERISLETLNQMVEQTNFIVNKGCSGTLVDIKNKLILTNYHCIDNNVSVVEKEETNTEGLVKKYKVKKYTDVVLEQNGYQGFDKVSTATYLGEIVAEQKSIDLAIVKIKSEIPHRIASKILPETMKVTRGENVYAVGNPGGMDASIVRGIISNLNRTFEFPWTDNNKLPMIQFSGGIYGGNSGGALYNDEGYLIGVPAAGFSAANFIGLAIPVDIVRALMRKDCLTEAFDVNANNAKCMEEKKMKEKEKDKK